jgi:hypothetical protein
MYGNMDRENGVGRHPSCILHACAIWIYKMIWWH